jgi:hypothetical protein
MAKATLVIEDTESDDGITHFKVVGTTEPQCKSDKECNHLSHKLMAVIAKLVTDGVIGQLAAQLEEIEEEANAQAH